jgi:tetratricopeptide (TPR) repeat protein
MAWRRGRADEAVALLTEALTFLERENLKHPVARVSSVLAEIDFREGRASEAVERLERALAELRGEEPDADVAEASAQLGRFLIMSDALDAAVPHLELALVLAQALELREILVHALTSKSVMYIRTNRLEEARILLEGALATARTHDLPSAAIRAINNLSVVFESSDLFTAAADVADQGQELARRIGDKLWEVNFLIGGLSACVMVGRWEEAYPRAAEAEELVPESARLPTMVPLFHVPAAPGAAPAAGGEHARGPRRAGACAGANGVGNHLPDDKAQLRRSA